MKKLIIFCVALATATSVSLFANIHSDSCTHHENATTEVKSSASLPACMWAGCRCPGFRTGGHSGAKCSNCGHMSFNHNY